MKIIKNKYNYIVLYISAIIFIFIIISIYYICKEEYILSIISLLILFNVLLFWSIVSSFYLYFIAGIFFTFIYSMYELKLEANLTIILYMNILVIFIQLIIYIISKKKNRISIN